MQQGKSHGWDGRWHSNMCCSAKPPSRVYCHLEVPQASLATGGSLCAAGCGERWQAGGCQLQQGENSCEPPPRLQHYRLQNTRVSGCFGCERMRGCLSSDEVLVASCPTPQPCVQLQLHGRGPEGITQCVAYAMQQHTGSTPLVSPLMGKEAVGWGVEGWLRWGRGDRVGCVAKAGAGGGCSVTRTKPLTPAVVHEARRWRR